MVGLKYDRNDATQDQNLDQSLMGRFFGIIDFVCSDKIANYDARCLLYACAELKNL